MKHNSFISVTLFTLLSLIFTSCSSKPKEEIQQAPLAPVAVENNKSEFQALTKAELQAKLTETQNSVYGLEDKIYGSEKLKTLGLYGQLKSCKQRQASRQYGGSGTLLWAEPLDRITEKEEDVKASASEEEVRQRLQRFAAYKAILQKRQADLEDRINACTKDIATHEIDLNQTARVYVSEVPKSSVERESINQYMCDYVRSGTSLKQLLLQAFAMGWLSLSDFNYNQNLISVAVKDSKGQERQNAMLFNGWKLVFDRGPLTVGEVLNGTNDASLMAWSFAKKSDITKASVCLKADEGVWNP